MVYLANATYNGAALATDSNQPQNPEGRVEVGLVLRQGTGLALSISILPPGCSQKKVASLMNTKETTTYSVRPVSRAECAPFILDIHYARRWPSISFAFGLFRNDELAGVVTYGTPPSAPLRAGVAGKARSHDVIELNRLCLLHNRKNEASMLVGRSLRLLPKGRIVVSFADTEQQHVGTVYQAANFQYRGLSAKRTDWKVRGKEHLHGQTVADEFRGCENRAQAMRDKYGSDFFLSPRPRKHRYIFCTDRRDYANILYPQRPYPKKLDRAGVEA